MRQTLGGKITQLRQESGVCSDLSPLKRHHRVAHLAYNLVVPAHSGHSGHVEICPSARCRPPPVDDVAADERSAVGCARVNHRPASSANPRLPVCTLPSSVNASAVRLLGCPIHEPRLCGAGPGQPRRPLGRTQGRFNAGTTRWPNRFSPPSSASSSTHARGRRGPDFDAASSSTSKRVITPAGCTRRSATSAPLNTKLSTTTPTVRRHNLRATCPSNRITATLLAEGGGQSIPGSASCTRTFAICGHRSPESAEECQRAVTGRAGGGLSRPQLAIQATRPTPPLCLGYERSVPTTVSTA